MSLRFASYKSWLITILAVAMLGVGLACSGDDATNTPPPATATTVPTAVATSATTPVPEPTPGESVADLTRLPGYKAEWGEPVRGGIMKLGIPQSPNSFAPNCSAGIYGPMCSTVYNYLLRYDPWLPRGQVPGNLRPDLMRSWVFSSDGLALSVTLQEGVLFQDNPMVPATFNGGQIAGDEFTCEDLMASMEYDVSPPERETRHSADAHLQHYAGTTCTDGPLGHTAVIHFDKVLGKTLSRLARGVEVLDKNWIEWYTDDEENPTPYAMGRANPTSFKLSTGYGPMLAVEYQADVVSKLRRNPVYWREGLPLLDGMDNFILKDATTRFTALATGQIHWYGAGSGSLQPGQISQAVRDFSDRIDLHETAYSFAMGLSKINLTRAPFNDRRVRYAMRLAIDLDEWIIFQRATVGDQIFDRAVFQGYVAPYELYPWGTPEDELRTWPGLRQPKDQDVAEANRLLDEVFGAGNRFDTPCITRNTQNYIDACMFLADQLGRNLDITVSLQPIELAALSDFTDVCNYGLQASAMLSSEGDPDFGLIDFSDNFPQSLPNQCHLDGMKATEPELQAQMQALVDAQHIELDNAARYALVQEFNKLATLEMVNSIPFGWMNLFYGTTGLGGYTLVGFPKDTYSVFERTWIKE
jgi:ABC-type transport system substrate-binding protein